jgi:hypothetical protein
MVHRFGGQFQGVLCEPSIISLFFLEYRCPCSNFFMPGGAVSATLAWSKLKTSRSKIPAALISISTESQIAVNFGGPCSASFGGPGEPSHIRSLENTAEISSR